MWCWRRRSRSGVDLIAQRWEGGPLPLASGLVVQQPFSLSRSAAEFSKSRASMAASLWRRTCAISRSSFRKSGLVPTRCSRIDKRRSMASIRLRSRAAARADGPDGPHGPQQHPRRADLSALVRRKAAEARRCGRCGRPGGTPQDSDTIWHARGTRGKRPIVNVCRRPDYMALELVFKELAGAPGRIRTRDPLLRRHLPGVAGGRLESFYMAISCIDRGWAWLEVALELSPLAPFLAPPISLPSLIPGVSHFWGCRDTSFERVF